MSGARRPQDVCSPSRPAVPGPGGEWLNDGKRRQTNGAAVAFRALCHGSRPASRSGRRRAQATEREAEGKRAEEETGTGRRGMHGVDGRGAGVGGTERGKDARFGSKVVVNQTKLPKKMHGGGHRYGSRAKYRGGGGRRLGYFFFLFLFFFFFKVIGGNWRLAEAGWVGRNLGHVGRYLAEGAGKARRARRGPRERGSAHVPGRPAGRGGQRRRAARAGFGRRALGGGGRAASQPAMHP